MAPSSLADIVGCLSGVSGLVFVNFEWNRAPSVGWSKPYVYIPLIVGLISSPSSDKSKSMQSFL
jgi:hypothetical protein